MFIVTIDSGTTNTRVRVWQGKALAADVSEPVGMRDTAVTGNRAALTAAIKKALAQALMLAGSQATDRCAIVASGMLTAESGLFPLPHLSTPVSLEQLARNAVAHRIPEISSQPIWFIPGVKNVVTSLNIGNLDAMDVMRGEEVETFGLLAQTAIVGPALIVLPGSHSKFVLVDKHQQIVSCATTMAGELLDVLTHHTLLANSLDGQFVTALDGEYLLRGAASCRRVGFARSCFSVRLLDLFLSASHDQKASYLLGATLCSDIQAIKNSQALAMTPEMPVVISGKAILKQALALLISADPFFTGGVVRVDEDPVRPLSGIGALAVMEKILSFAAGQDAPHSAVISQEG